MKHSGSPGGMGYASGSEREGQLAEGKLRVVLQEHRFHPVGRKDVCDIFCEIPGRKMDSSGS